MKTKLRILSIAGTVLLGLVACGDSSSGSSTGSGPVSGRYVADITEAGIKMEFDFAGDGKTTLTMDEGGERSEMDCTYTSGERRIAVSCFGSSGISLTQLEGGDLEGDMDGMIVRYKKR
ncbi:MAG: hypothetical protein O3A63_06270 [Proteobacteria bacterium]|nr:hypothetical protein [Pseudomonadota bacterium]